MTSMCRKCIFYLILTLPILSPQDKAPDDGRKLCVAINIKIEEYITTHSFASPWTLRKQNLIWQ